MVGSAGNKLLDSQASWGENGGFNPMPWPSPFQPAEKTASTGLDLEFSPWEPPQACRGGCCCLVAWSSCFGSSSLPKNYIHLANPVLEKLHLLSQSCWSVGNSGIFVSENINPPGQTETETGHDVFKSCADSWNHLTDHSCLRSVWELHCSQ